MLAGHGIAVAVPEIFHEMETPGKVLAYDQPGADRGNHDKITKTIASYDDDARAVIKYLQTAPFCTGKIGSFGVCIGGHLSFRASMNPEILAGACFYATDIHKRSLGQGMNDNSLDRIPGTQNVALMMVWGRQGDPHIPAEGRLIYQKMTEHRVRLYLRHVQRGTCVCLCATSPRYGRRRSCFPIVIGRSFAGKSQPTACRA